MIKKKYKIKFWEIFIPLLNNNTMINDNKVITNNYITLRCESIDTIFNKHQQLNVLNKDYGCLDYLEKVG